MNKYKIAGISVISVIVILYAIFLFVLPNAVNLNNYKEDIQKIVKDSAKLDIDAKNIKLVTTPKLAAGVEIDGLTVGYPGGEKIVSADNALVRVKLLPFLWKTLQLDTVSAKNPVVNLNITNGTNLEIVDYLEKAMPAQEPQTEAAGSMPVNISPKMPVISVNSYDLTLKDKPSGNSIKISGGALVIDKTVLNKHFRVATNGKILFNNRENVNYNVKIDSFLPEATESKPVQAAETTNINFISELIKYDIKGDVNTDLKVRHALDNGLKIDGFLNIDKFSTKIGTETLPESYAHLSFKGSEINAESDINVSSDEKLDVSAYIKHAKKMALDLNIKTEKLSFSNILKFVNALCCSLNIPTDLSKMTADGYITSDFTLKTDLKNFESNGFFKILNGAIAYSGINATIDKIGADIDFSNNNVNIKKASALVNGALLELKGTIDSKSNADIVLNSQVIPLNSLYAVFAPVNLKNTYELQNGTIRLNAEVKGKLEDIQPVLTLNIDNLKIKDKVNGLILSNQNTAIDIKAKSDSFSGLADITGTKATLLNPAFRVNIPEVKIEIDPKNIVIVPFEILADSSVINISGSVKNYMEQPVMNIIADGNICAADLKALLPAEMRSLVQAKGKMPVFATVNGDLKTIYINAQAKADSANHFTPVNIKKILNKPSIVSASITYANDALNIEDIGLYALASDTFAKDTKKNLHGAEKLAGITGSVSNLSKAQNMKLAVNIPDPLLLSLPVMPTASLKTRGHLNLSGNTAAPDINGYVKISAIGLPDFLTKIETVDLNFNQGMLNADIQQLSLNGSVFNIAADAPLKFENIFVINKLTLTSPNLNADKIFEISDKVAQSQGAAASSAKVVKRPVYPVKILSGEGTIDKFTMGTIAASNISSKFTMSNDVVYLKGLKASAYNGTLSGDVSYDLVSLLAKAKVSGKSIDANSAVTAFVNLKDQLMGSLDFNADISLKGAEYTEQMKTLKGKADFKITDGQLGSLGRIETFLRADNLLSQSLVSTHIGSLISQLGPYNSGKFSYLNGEMTFGGGNANISYIKSSGPHAALNISGTLNLVNNDAKFEILGRISPEIVTVLGPVAELSVENIAALIPKLGSAISGAMNSYNIKSSAALLEKIPDLTPVKDGTKAFKVELNGSLNAPQSAIKSFRWLNSEQDMQTGETTILDLLKTPETTEKPAITKEAVKEDIKKQIQQSETVQKIQENETFQQLNSIFQMYKDARQKDNEAKEQAQEQLSQ